MNLFFVYDDGRIVTPETGTILEGITRDSILQLAGDRGHTGRGAPGLDRRVARRRRLRRDHRGLRLRHRRRRHPGRRAPLADGGVTPAPASTELTMQIREALVDIQFGRAEDTYGWMHRVV